MFALLLYIAVIWLIVWAIIKLIPMQPPGPTIIVVVASIASVIIVLQAFGIHLPDPGVPRLR